MFGVSSFSAERGNFMKLIYTTTSTAGMSREDWLRLRKTGLGGSDAGAVCGLNPYSSPMKVYLDKTADTAEETDNESMRQGRDLEEYVARRFAEETSLSVRRSLKLYRNRQYPWMIADVDRLIVGEDAGLECKTASLFQADQWKDGAIPPHYLMQCLHYMAVTGKKAWYLAVVILGKEFQYRKIVREERLIQPLIEIEERFWKGNVLLRRMPDPDGSESCEEALGSLYRKAKETERIPLIGFDERLERREEVIREIEALEREQKKIEQEVKLYLKEYETAASDRFLVSWSNVDTRRLDTKRIKEERPEIYEEFSKVTSTRKLSIKAA